MEPIKDSMQKTKINARLSTISAPIVYNNDP